MRPLAETTAPPRHSGAIRVIRAPAKGFFYCTVLSNRLWGCWSHWCGSHTEACLCSDSDREANVGDFTHRWKGFLHIQMDGTGKQFFLEISNVAALELLAKLEPKASLRGLFLKVRREPEHLRGS